ncbi:hypothetical protein GCM10011452_38380 [Gemmobacter lanyuensis]|uniref:Uncharacterized protein n=2 Tax=Gemmobacter lanyuensis TaxID=1054497 RepID=A0A918J5U3_9RHOB|nr:hypothetical protein GCM10011452_38380 [Gemmobacter lanyuensis]
MGVDHEGIIEAKLFGRARGILQNVIRPANRIEDGPQIQLPLAADRALGHRGRADQGLPQTLDPGIIQTRDIDNTVQMKTPEVTQLHQLNG